MDMFVVSFVLLLVSLIVAPQKAAAFSAAGHEAVCEIAYRELTPTAKLAVDELIATETDDRFKTFRDACVWPDVVSGGPTEDRDEDHYINVPRTWHYIRYNKPVSVWARCSMTSLTEEARLDFHLFSENSMIPHSFFN